MARYRKIDVRIWNDEAFAGFGDESKLAFLFLLTHPNLTSLGAMRATRAGLAEELGWSLPKFTRAFGAILTARMAEHDQKAAFLWLPNFLRYNPAENGNVVKGWVKALDLLPECPLRGRMLDTARLHCDTSPVKGVAEAFAETFGKPLPKPFGGPSGTPSPNGMPNQEQEPDLRTGSPDDDDHVGGSGASTGDVVSSTARTTNRGGPEHVAVLELVALWNRIRTTANTVAMPMGPKAYGPLVDAVRRRDLSAWEETFRRVESSDYLAGRLDLPGLTLWDAIDRAEIIDAGKYAPRKPALPATSTSRIDDAAMARVAAQVFGVSEADASSAFRKGRAS